MGPYQSCGFSTAEACIAAGSHFLDLADCREYVESIGPALDAKARTAGVVVLAGCSTTPALTSAVVDAFSCPVPAAELPSPSRPQANDELGEPEQTPVFGGDGGPVCVDVSLSPGNKLPRGIATVSSVVSYVRHGVLCVASFSRCPTSHCH